MAVLDNQAIPRMLLTKEDVSEEVAEMESLQVLLDFSLIKGDAEGEFFSMHPLQQLVSSSRAPKLYAPLAACEYTTLAKQSFHLRFLVALTRDLHVCQY